MKKIYTKPQIEFEDFVMSTNIAADCEVQPNTNTNYNSCAHLLGDRFIFGSDLTGCKKYNTSASLVDPYNGYGSGANNQICYHTPTIGNNIFNS